MERPDWFPLQTCSPDILREIFIHMTAKEISLLHACGNRTLNLKIGAPRTVQKWEMRIDVDATRKWPSLISHLKTMKEIDIVATFPTHFTDIFGLPKSLESIRFEFWEAESLFALPLSQAELKHSIINGPTIPNFLNMSLLFPNLKHLMLEGSECASDYFISTLPENLETLELCSDRKGNLIMITASCLDRLPRSLRRLKMTAPFLNGETSFSKLPRSLTSLELSGGVITGPCLPQLPSELRALIIPNMARFGDADVILLPRTLEVLDVLESDSLSCDCFEHLPRTLKEFTMWRLENRSAPPTPLAPKIALLPPGLESFKAMNAHFWDDASTNALPRSLRHLVLHKVQTRPTNAFASFLPPSLLTLVLFCERAEVSSACFRDLPRSLTKLELVSRKEFADFDCTHLPPNLLDLDLAFATQLTDACIALLPRSLTRIYLRHNTQISGKSAIDLPRGLLFLSLSSCRSYSSQYFKHLPRTLAHLALHSVVDVSPSAFKELPRELKYLDLFSSPAFAPHFLNDLPRSIRHLFLSSVELCHSYYLSIERSKSGQEKEIPPPSTSSTSTGFLQKPLNALWQLLAPFGH